MHRPEDQDTPADLPPPFPHITTHRLASSLQASKRADGGAEMAEEVPCSAPLQGAAIMLRLRGRRKKQTSSTSTSSRSTSTSSSSDNDGINGAYPLVYWGMTTECRGCDLPPLAAVVDLNDTTCLRLDSLTGRKCGLLGEG